VNDTANASTHGRAPAIRVRGLSKRYRIGQRAYASETFREAIMRLLQKPFGPRASSTEPFWALRDVSFDVAQGEVLGVIGRNGAGKSTLLKVLTGITEPTEGVVELYGRVASLLEIGTGFHGELTGRENVFLNGAILGMKRREIHRKLDEIVAFAEVERFLDTPVKRYSSGMYMRLAFAVAAHLEQEILLVDEVLAVGDATFQKKCLGKMGDVAHEGRTVVFVTHHMAALRQLTERALLLDGGQVVFAGALEDAIDRYLARPDADAGVGVFKRARTAVDENAGATILEVTAALDDEGRFTATVTFATRRKLQAAISVRIFDSEGAPVFTVRDVDGDPSAMEKEPGEHRVRATTVPLHLSPGLYTVSVSLSDLIAVRHDHVDRCVTLEAPTPRFLRSPFWREGPLTPDSTWVRLREAEGDRREPA
jgi:lipopolysaccharide transport system ATP-binding protein